jgi:hypothetical protein
VQPGFQPGNIEGRFDQAEQIAACGLDAIDGGRPVAVGQREHFGVPHHHQQRGAEFVRHGRYELGLEGTGRLQILDQPGVPQRRADVMGEPRRQVTLCAGEAAGRAAQAEVQNGENLVVVVNGGIEHLSHPEPCLEVR